MHAFPRIALLFAVMTVFGTLVVPPARAQIIVSAPVPAAAQSLSAWYVRHVPLRFRATSRVAVRELADTDMNAYLEGGSGDASHVSANDMGDVDGVYESDPDRIALRLPPARGIDMFTFAHEYGHYVWFALLSDDDRRRYQALYKKRRATGHLVTRYAETSVEEGFAEAFSFYAAEPPILAARDPASFQFLTQWGTRPHATSP